MDMWPRIAEVLITPPGIVVLLLLLTFFAYLRRQWLGAAMLVLSTIALVALSLPLTAHQLMNGLENFSKPPELVPMAEKGTCPVMHTIGDESSMAVAIPVTMFVAPGPDVAMATPTRPVARA